MLHRCLCGYLPLNYKGFRRHKLTCETWLNRPNPRGLSISRRAATRKARYAHQCVPTVEELRDIERFRLVLDRHKMSYRAFAVFLHVLNKRYTKNR